jgi:hypothetical protein
MEMFPTPPANTRLGFHYFPDAIHYRENDLNTWLPELRALGASWVTLVAPNDRAIPEVFIRGLVSAGIEPILHFHLPLDQSTQINDIRLLFHTYARWGVHYVVPFDRPNLRTSWPATAWAQSNLVERFLDIYLPLAKTATQAGLIPIFPPLEPGGDYWDTAFLRGALQGIQRRGYQQLLQKLAIGAYAFPGNRPLGWGAGGPERWPGSRPYHTPQGSQDQRGFRIFDWYLAQVRAVVDTPCTIMLLGAGCRPGDQFDPAFPPVDRATHAKTNLSIAALMIGKERLASKSITSPEDQEAVPAEVLACNFWLLASSKDSPFAGDAWIQPDGNTLPAAGAMRQWYAKLNDSAEQHQPQTPRGSVSHNTSQSVNSVYRPHKNGHSIQHYLLLPTYEWGIADWHLDVIRPFVKKYRPTIGFSIKEAKQAARVTLIGGYQSFPATVLDELRSANCMVEQISGDGTSIASQLATL